MSGKTRHPQLTAPNPSLTPPFPPHHIPFPAPPSPHPSTAKNYRKPSSRKIRDTRPADTGQSKVARFANSSPGTTTLGPLQNTGSHLKQLSQHPLRQREHLLTSTPAATAFAAASNSAFFQSDLAPNPLPAPFPIPPALIGAVSAAPQIAHSRDTPRAPISAGGRSSNGRGPWLPESPPVAALATLSPIFSGCCRSS